MRIYCLYWFLNTHSLLHIKSDCFHCATERSNLSILSHIHFMKWLHRIRTTNNRHNILPSPMPINGKQWKSHAINRQSEMEEYNTDAKVTRFFFKCLCVSVSMPFLYTLYLFSNTHSWKTSTHVCVCVLSKYQPLSRSIVIASHNACNRCGVTKLLLLPTNIFNIAFLVGIW